MSALKSRPGTAPSKMCDNITLYNFYSSYSNNNRGLVCFYIFWLVEIIIIITLILLRRFMGDCVQQLINYCLTFCQQQNRDAKKYKTRSCPLNNHFYPCKNSFKTYPSTHIFTQTHTCIHQTSIIIYCSKHDGSDLFCIIITNINQVRERLKVPPLFEKEITSSVIFIYIRWCWYVLWKWD